MDIKQLAKDHIKDSFVMQLATSRDNQPWACNLHFIADDDLNLYWMSVPDCRHSEDIAANPQVSAVFAISEHLPLIGVQVEGRAEQVVPSDHRPLLQKYAERHERKDFIEGVLSGKAQFKLYRLIPHMVQIIDFKNFPQAPKQQWRA